MTPKTTASPRRLWIFDRPVLNDPLFLAALALSAIHILVTVIRRDDFGAGAIILTLALSLPSALVAVGSTAGTLREFRRARASR